MDEYLQQRSVDIIAKPFPDPSKPIVWNYAVGMLRVLVVNRDQAFNALNNDMIQLYMDHLVAFEKSELVSMIGVVNNKYSKAFCAGGDIKELYAAAKLRQSGVPYESKDGLLPGSSFFRGEYTLNYLISVLSKPYVAVMDGITMGGGAGISMHSNFRLV